MDKIAYREYQEESSDWLRVGRTRLVCDLVERYRPRAEALEILEVGAGVGQNIPALASFGVVDGVEINPVGQEAIRSQGIARMLFTESLPFELDRKYDVVCALDVIEHIEDDAAALRWIADHLRSTGILIATVPAYQALFSDHDRALHHYRRYTRTSFRAALPESLTTVTAAYFNHFLFPVAVLARGAWALKRRVLSSRGGKQRSPKSAALSAILGGVLDIELGLIRRGYRPPWGLSVYCVARLLADQG